MKDSSDARFAITPETNLVQSFQRDMRFWPVHNPSPELLSAEQISSFNRNGFLTGLAIFDQAAAIQHRSYFDQLLSETLSQGADAYSISSAHLNHGYVYDLLTHPTLVQIAVDLLGPNVIGWGSHFFCKLPEEAKPVHWHQDVFFWPMSHSKSITIWLAIDDTDEDNGCVLFVPGSHLQGLLPHHDSSDDVLGKQAEYDVDSSQVIPSPLLAGQASVHADLVVHGSNPNLSTRRRCGLTLRYCSADVEAGLDWHEKGVVVAGQDWKSHWANPKRPVNP